jgi:hypothetical protein
MISTAVEGNVHRKAMGDDEVATQADWNIMIQSLSGKQKCVLIERWKSDTEANETKSLEICYRHEATRGLEAQRIQVQA